MGHETGYLHGDVHFDYCLYITACYRIADVLHRSMDLRILRRGIMKFAIALFAALVVCGCSDRPGGYKADIDKTSFISCYKDNENGVACYTVGNGSGGHSIFCVRIGK